MGVRQARAQLPAVLRLAAEGQPVMLTRHGMPVAVLLPAAAGDLWQRHLDDNQRAGLRQDQQGTTAGGPPADDANRGGATALAEALSVPARGVGRVPGHVGQGPPVDGQAGAVMVCIPPVRGAG